MDMNNMTMLELLEDISNTVEDYWEEEKNDSFTLKDTDRILYGDKILELMAKAVFDNETEEHTQESIASRIGVTASTFSKFKTGSTNISKKNFKKIVDAILLRLDVEENLADDEMKKRINELLVSIFRREEIGAIVEQFMISPKNIWDGIDKGLHLACHHEGV